MENLLELLQKVPWEAVWLIVVPIAIRLAKLIKDAELRALYIKLVRWAEKKYGAGAGEEKKAAVADALAEEGKELDEKLLEAAVHEVAS